nr:hypothetical protein [Candidatus Aenigmarchaeota archaeon]
AVKGVKDTQCGFKIFSKKAADDIFSLLKTGGWGFDMEVLTIAQVHGYKIKEVPVEWHEVGGGKINFMAYLQSLKDLLRIKWYKIIGQYNKKKLLKMRSKNFS